MTHLGLTKYDCVVIFKEEIVRKSPRHVIIICCSNRLGFLTVVSSSYFIKKAFQDNQNLQGIISFCL